MTLCLDSAAMENFDFHTHNLQALPGSAIVNLPQEALLHPETFSLVEGVSYSAGVHPWWTDGDWQALWEGVVHWTAHPQVVALGECGLDALRGADWAVQEAVFLRHLYWAEECHLPVTIHCVRAFDRLLRLRKTVRPQMKWTIHGFRGKPQLARQLLEAGFDLSFGARRNAESWALTPPDRRHWETDDDF